MSHVRCVGKMSCTMVCRSNLGPREIRDYRNSIQEEHKPTSDPTSATKVKRPKTSQESKSCRNCNLVSNLKEFHFAPKEMTAWFFTCWSCPHSGQLMKVSSPAATTRPPPRSEGTISERSKRFF